MYRALPWMWIWMALVAGCKSTSSDVKQRPVAEDGPPRLLVVTLRHRPGEKELEALKAACGLSSSDTVETFDAFPMAALRCTKAGAIQVAQRAGVTCAHRPVEITPRVPNLEKTTSSAEWYVRVLRGLDFFLRNRAKYDLRVINLSLGPTDRYPFVADEPVNVATKIATSAGITVVIAAGNEGGRRISNIRRAEPVCVGQPNPNVHGDSTLNPWAVAPWVVGVGGTVAGPGSALWSKSSRGIVNDSLYHPAVVSDVRGLFDDTNKSEGTSFAAPRVATAIRLVYGFFDYLMDALKTAGHQLPETSVDEVRRVLTAMAQPVDGALHERGDGYVDMDVARTFLKTLDRQRLLTLSPKWSRVPDRALEAGMMRARSAMESQTLDREIRIGMIDMFSEWFRPVFVGELIVYSPTLLGVYYYDFLEDSRIEPVLEEIRGQLQIQAFFDPRSLGRRLVVASDGTGQYSRIQDALEHAQYWDRIIVKRGTYQGPITMKSGVSIIGDGPDQVRLVDGTGYAINMTEVSDSLVSGISIEQQQRRGATILVQRSKNIAINNVALSAKEGNGATVISSWRIVFEECAISAGVSGVFALDSTRIAIHSSFVRSQSTGVLFYQSSGQVISNTIISPGTGINSIVPDLRGPRGTIHVIGGSGMVALDGARIVVSSIGSQEPEGDVAHLLFGLDVVDNIIMKSAVGVATNAPLAVRVETNDFWLNKAERGLVDGPVVPIYKLSDMPATLQQLVIVEDASTPLGNNLVVDPLFVSEVDGDYRLRPDSPLAGAGQTRSFIGALPPVTNDSTAP